MTPIELIDSHAHLSKEESFEQIEEVLKRAKLAGVSKIINICTNEETLQRGLIIAQKHRFVFNTAATTPHDAETEGDALFPLMEKAARSGHLVAVGETGLDYFYYANTKSEQQRLFKRYLHLALDCRLPIVIHCRDAFEDFFSILDSDYRINGQWGPGVLHCFTGTVQEAEEVLKRDWYISLSGIVTFKKSLELKKVAEMVPLNRLLIETDTPYLAPQSRRGKLNEPSYLLEIAAHIAELKGVPLIEVAKSTYENAHRLFRLPITLPNE